MTEHQTPAQRLADALTAADGSDRLQAALAAGTFPDASYLEPLVARCGVEDDFAVREMLTWAIIHLPGDVLPRVLEELDSESALAQSQALHTISKLGDERAWPAITSALLHSADDEVARTAWRAAIAVAPEDELSGLAQDFVRELGRSGLIEVREGLSPVPVNTEIWRSLSRALVSLGEHATAPLVAALTAAEHDGDLARLVHARVTVRLLEDPDASFALEPADAHRRGNSRTHD